MRRSLRMISGNGDDTLATWDTETVSPQQLAKIEAEFNRRMASGYFAADITDKRDVIVRQFDPNANLLLIPRVQGG